MNLEKAVLKRKITWSGLFVSMLLRTWLAFRSLLWGRFWPPPTKLGALPGRLREKSKRPSKFHQGWTRSKAKLNFPPKPFYTPPRSLKVTKPYYLPPTFLKCNRCDKVFVSLLRAFVRCPVHLDHYLTEMKGKIRYSAETREWILGSIRFSELTYQAFKFNFGSGRFIIEVKPVTEEAH